MVLPPGYSGSIAYPGIPGKVDLFAIGRSAGATHFLQDFAENDNLPLDIASYVG